MSAERLADEIRASECPSGECVFASPSDHGGAPAPYCVVCGYSPTEEEHDYAALADELNDADVTMTVDDFEPTMVARALLYTRRAGLSFPPAVGDFDRYYEQRRR